MSSFWQGFEKRAEDYSDPTGHRRTYSGQTDDERRDFDAAVNREVEKLNKGIEG